MNGKRFMAILSLATILVLVVASMSPALADDPTTIIDPAPDEPDIVSAPLTGGHPVMFIENVGQFSKGALYQVRGSAGALWLAHDALWLTVQGSGVTVQGSESDEQPAQADSLPWTVQGSGGEVSSQPALALSGYDGGPAPEPGPLTPEPGSVSLRLSFVGANPAPKVEAFGRLATRVSYFRGSDPAGWHANVPVWGGVRYEDVYPGIDLEMTGASNRLVVRGGDVARVRLRVEGADSLALDDGVLKARTVVGDVVLPLFEAVGGGEALMAGGHPAVEGNVVTRPFSPSPAAPILQRNLSTLLYSTFLGSTSCCDHGHGIAVDGGNAYVTGVARWSDFPSTPGAYDSSHNGLWDVFVTEMNSDGSDIVFSTFIGGASDDIAEDIVVTSDALFVAGTTGSTAFPTQSGSYDRSLGGTRDAFVAKLTKTGDGLTWSTLLGGAGNDHAYGLAVDSSGNAYVGGSTGSTTSVHAGNFPTTAGALDRTFGGYLDGFVAKLSADGATLTYATYVGGGLADFVRDIAIDSSGRVFAVGGTASTDFPVTAGSYDSTANGFSDAFAVKLNAAGSALVYGAYLGGAGSDEATDVRVTSTGRAFVLGYTNSDGFPTTTDAYDRTYNGGTSDVFLVQLGPAGSALLHATFLGGAGDDKSGGLAIDGSENVSLTGYTRSTNFPYTNRGYDTTHNGGLDAFVTRLNMSSGMIYSTYLGGSADGAGLGHGDDQGRAIAVDSDGVSYVTGSTQSTNFPTTAGAFDTTLGGGNAFVAKVQTIFYKKYVNAGSTTLYTAADRTVWSADRTWAMWPITWGYVGSSMTTSTTAHAIAGTTDDALYQSSRINMSAYNFTVPDGTFTFTVRLKFSENYYTAANRRVFDVIVEGTTVLDDFDIWAAAGNARYTAVDRRFTNVVVADGVLNIGFVGVTGKPAVSAISVVMQ